MHSTTSIFTDGTCPNVLFMPGVFNEAMQLLTDAHEYFGTVRRG